MATGEFDLSFAINNLKIETGEVNDTFQVMFNNNVGLIGTVNKSDGSLREVMMIGQGDGTAQSGLNLIGTIGALIATTNPTLTADNRVDVLEDLGLFDESIELSSIDQMTIRNGIKYRIIGSDYIGITFIVSEAD